MGRPIITERLGAYLGSVIAGHYHQMVFIPILFPCHRRLTSHLAL